MTRLTIIPNVEKKRLTFDGRIASGEHVELRVFDFADKIEEGRLRVRAVDFQGNTLAVFPVKSRDENGDVKKDENGNDVWEQWGVDEDYGYATCVFNLNTIPALKYFRRGGECLIVLDDPESKTLYGTGHLCVMPWPKEIGKDEPVDLDSYPDNIRDFVRRLDDAEDNVEICRRDVESALSFASNANTNANTAVTTAQNAMSASSEAKTSAANALTDSAAAKKAAQDAEGLVSAAQNAAQSAQDAVKNLADVAKSGSYNDLANKPAIPSIKGLATTNEVEKSEARSRAELLVEVSRAKTAEGELDKSIAKKADATALATETQRAKDKERDLEERIAALKSFDVKVVDALPISGISNTVYLVPSRKSADLNVRDEYLWLDGAWEQIGSTSVDLTDYAKKSELPRRPEDIGAQNALNPSQLAAVNSGITADKVAKMALKEDVPTKTSDLENDSNFAADVLERTCVHTYNDPNVQAMPGVRKSANEWTFDYKSINAGPVIHLRFDPAEGTWMIGFIDPSGHFNQMSPTVHAAVDVEELDFGQYEGVVTFSGVDDMVARSGQIPKVYVKDAVKSADGKTLTLTKNDGSTVSFQGGGGGGAVSSVNGKTGAVVLTGSNINVSETDAQTVAKKLSAKQDALTDDQIAVLDGGPYLSKFKGRGIESATLGEYNEETGEAFDGILVVTDIDTNMTVVKGNSINVGSGIGDTPASIKKNGEEVATEEQVNAVSDKVDEIKSTVSTDNRFLVNGTTAAIQTRTDETAEWTNEIRVDKGYDALQGNTMVKLDKSVQAVTVAGSNLVIEIPDSVDGTVRDLCVYANNSSNADTALTFPAGTYYGDDPNGAVAKAGKVTAVYLTEIPKGAWMLRITELDQHEVTA